MSDATEERGPTRPDLLADSPATAPADPAVSEQRLVEARRAYAREVAALDAIDGTVQRSVRTSVVILGFVCSAVGVAGPDAVAARSVGVAVSSTLGVCALLAATLCGLGLLTATERQQVGSPSPGQGFRTAMSSPAATRALLVEYVTATRAVEAAVDAHASGLARVHRLLALGIVSLSAAAGAFVLRAGYGVDGTFATVGLWSVVLVVVSAGSSRCDVGVFAGD